MLALPKRFPIVKASSLGVGVFAIGFVGSIALLTYFHPGLPDEGGTNVATHRSPASKPANKKKAVASAEPNTSANTGRSGTMTVTGVMPEKNTAVQPVAKYAPPTSTKSAAPVATTGSSSGSSVLNVTTAPSSPTPIQVVSQPAPTSPSPSPSTGGTNGGLPLQQTVQPVFNTTKGVTSSLLGN